ncbi:MAG: SDR family NAD(P)-dependent oxidoreductase [Clostridia bacterium]|nr:SDR family NAD(P)-dependent oxidoreductase [Clostridia bacterium]
MRALITGASSGLGELFALQLSEMGYDIVVTARREDKLEQLTKKQKPM